MEKWKIVYVLPLEVWMDIFCFPWISRRKFGQFVARIGNFKFAEHAQFYLHEWGKRKLGNLVFKEEGFCKFLYPKHYRLEYPQTPMPENIRSFNHIRISHLDAQTMDFLGKIRPLLTDVEISIGDIFHLDNLRTILTNLAPMLEDGIPSLYCSDDSGFSMVKEQLLSENEKLAKLKMLQINFILVTEMEQQETVTFIMNWLALPDTDGPRFLQFDSEDDFFQQIFEAIRKEFLTEKTPRIFAVNFNHERFEFADFHLENGIGEALHGIWTEVDYEEVFQITRHPASWNTKEAQKWIDEMTKERDWPCIWIEWPTIGSLAAAPQVDVQPVDEAQIDQQPSTSKKA